MKLNCKAGDLAITVGAFLNANRGRVVEVISPVGLKSWPRPYTLLTLRLYSNN